MNISNLISKRSIDQLEQDIVSFAGCLNQAEYKFLVLIREFDPLQGRKDYHFNNCAEWIAGSYLSDYGDKERAASSTDHYQIMVHVDEAALGEQAPDSPQCNQAKSDLPIESVRRLCCDGNLVPIVKDENGNPLNAGRKHRVVQPALRRALLARDKCCRFPGCAHDRWLDAQGLPRFIGYHVMHWADGGETSLANTLLLCSKHHRLLHEGGFTIHKNHAGEWYFKNEKGHTIIDAPVFRAKVVEGFQVSETYANYLADSSPLYRASRDAAPVATARLQELDLGCC